MSKARARLRIGIVSPSAATRRTGNVHTARRYAGFLRSAGHRVRLLPSWDGEALDVLIALHARKSAGSVLAFAKAHPERPIILVLTGTDVYRDLARSKRAQRALELATQIIMLQPDAITRIPRRYHAKATAIIQSAQAAVPFALRSVGVAQMCVLGHLRPEKDPLRAAYGLRYVPKDVPLRVVQAGAALEKRYLLAAHAIMKRDRRYLYAGDIAHGRALRLLAASTALIVSSKMEGGANVLSEAIAAGTPVIASRISGNLGILGRAYPAYYPVGDTQACARLMQRCAQDPSFVRTLRAWVRRLRPLVTPTRERRMLLDVLARAAIETRR